MLLPSALLDTLLFWSALGAFIALLLLSALCLLVLVLPLLLLSALLCLLVLLLLPLLLAFGLLLLFLLLLLLTLGLLLLLFRLSLLLLFRGLSLLFLSLLCVRGSNGSEKKEQNSCTDKSNLFHECCLHHGDFMRPRALRRARLLFTR